MRFFIKNITNQIKSLTVLSSNLAKAVSGDRHGDKLKGSKSGSESTQQRCISILNTGFINKVTGGSSGTKGDDPRLEGAKLEALSMKHRSQLDEDSITRVIGGSGGNKVDTPKVPNTIAEPSPPQPKLIEKCDIRKVFGGTGGAKGDDPRVLLSDTKANTSSFAVLDIGEIMKTLGGSGGAKLKDPKLELYENHRPKLKL